MGRRCECMGGYERRYKRSCLVLESGSLDVLIERVRMAVPDLLKLNNQPLEHAKIVFLNLSRVCGGDPGIKTSLITYSPFVPRMRG